MLAERLLQRAAGADKSGFDPRADVGFVFAADLGEELIQVMDDADLLCSCRYLRCATFAELSEIEFSRKGAKAQTDGQVRHSKLKTLKRFLLEFVLVFVSK